MAGGSIPCVASEPTRYDDLKLHLRVLDEDHVIEAKARLGPMRLIELLPLARTICEGITAISLARVKAEGRTISCKAGCGACCRQLAPISPAEAVRLAKVVEGMPKGRRRAVKERFAAAVKRMEEAGLLDPQARPGSALIFSTKSDGREAWEDASRRYFKVGVPCPFLEDESCSIYAERPMVCREYLVTTPPSLCASLDPSLQTAPWPVHMSEVFVALMNELLGRDDRSIPLILALAWARDNHAAFDHQGDGEELARALVQSIQDADDAG